MKLYVDPTELLFLDGILQKVVIEEQAPPCAYALAGKVKRMIGKMVEAMPNEPLAA